MNFLAARDNYLDTLLLNTNQKLQTEISATVIACSESGIENAIRNFFPSKTSNIFNKREIPYGRRQTDNGYRP